ncbi:MAG: hypothetical protein JXN64_00030 [Spirochaetes bacterium]|nr:hypothetical protein [Spirochaetota bacterium]
MSILNRAVIKAIDLVPVLRKYVDKKKDENPGKYYYPLKDIYVSGRTE